MVIKNKRDEMVKFDFIKEGEVFILYGEDICMKIESVDDTYCNIYNMVKLVDGTLDCCSGDTMVQPIKCELIIE